MNIRVIQENDNWLCVAFTYDEELVKRIKQMDKRRYLPERKVWLIPYTVTSVHQFLTYFSDLPLHIEERLREGCPDFARYVQEQSERDEGIPPSSKEESVPRKLPI